MFPKLDQAKIKYRCSMSFRYWVNWYASVSSLGEEQYRLHAIMISTGYVLGHAGRMMFNERAFLDADKLALPLVLVTAVASIYLYYHFGWWHSEVANTESISQNIVATLRGIVVAYFAGHASVLMFGYLQDTINRLR